MKIARGEGVEIAIRTQRDKERVVGNNMEDIEIRVYEGQGGGTEGESGTHLAKGNQQQKREHIPN